MSEHVKGTPRERGIAAINITRANEVIDMLTAELSEHRQDCRDQLCYPAEYTKLLMSIKSEDALRITLAVAIERLI